MRINIPDRTYEIGNQQRKPILRNFPGVNKLDPFNIDEHFATDTINRTINENGEHVTRPGYAALGSANGTRVLGLGVWKDVELHAVFNDGSWRKWNGTTWITLLAPGTLSTTAEWTFTNYKGSMSAISLIGTNGVNPARYYDGGTVKELSGVPSGANYITLYADRLWAAVGNELHASAYRNPTQWNTFNGDDADSWYVDIETPNGEIINGIIPGMTKLIATKPSSIHKLMGSNPSDFAVPVVTTTVGQFNNKSGVMVDGWLYQIDDAGFYRYAGGNEPERGFSERIGEYFGRINATGKAFSALGTDGLRVYISLPINGDVNDTLLVYDTVKDMFFVWEDITALHFAQLGTDLYVGDASGRVLKLGGVTDNGSAIEWYWSSIPFTGQSMSQKIRFSRMWATVDLPTGSTMEVLLSKAVDGGEWVSVGTATPAADIQRKQIHVASNKAGNANQIRFKISGSGPCTIHEVAWVQTEV